MLVSQTPYLDHTDNLALCCATVTMHRAHVGVVMLVDVAALSQSDSASELGPDQTEL